MGQIDGTTWRGGAAVLLVALLMAGCGASDGAAVVPEPDPERHVNLFVDSDYQMDVDDLMAHAQVFGHAELSEVSLLGMVSASTCSHSPLAMERMNRWHGFPNVPVGGWGGDDGNYDTVNAIASCGPEWPGRGPFAKPVADSYPGDLTEASTPSALEVYREVLSAEPDGSVTLLVIGFHTSLYEFLTSPAEDGYPSGVDLANAKLDKIVVGGSREGGSPNFNFTQAPDYARWVLDNSGPGRTVDVPFIVQPNNNSEPGRSHTNMTVGSDLVNEDEDQIVRFAMEEFVPPQSPGHAAWDLMATLAAVRGSDYAWDPVEGTFTYPEEADRETWTPGSGGPHIRLESTESTQFYIDAIDALLFRPEVSQAMESGG